MTRQSSETISYEQAEFMVLLSELVKIVAEVEGLDEVSVGIYARSAREAGHIKQGGRGRAAAKMDVRDAANLLIAVNACTLAKDVAEAVPVYRSMQIEDETYTGKDRALLTKVGVFRSGATFGTDLEQILSFCGDPERRKLLDEPGGVIVEFLRPRPKAQIALLLRNDDGAAIDIRGFYWPVDRKSPARVGDRADHALISSRTLTAVAEALQA
ncbi:hypothetical protein ACETIH_03170 [Microvirga arabica]|uniref:Uncharacterized protein n=1 Tax=Microvirga arabica TaxID=1128671 RepID=A0ABV6Y3H4_9HYPH